MGDDHRFPLEIKNGYWLTFAPAFHPTSVIRDFPLGIEPSEKTCFQGRTFVDLVGDGAGLLVLHPGTQYFKRDAQGVVSNLIMREWESYFTQEYGWPRYSEYHHILLPHDGSLSNSERVRFAEALSQKLITIVRGPATGNLPTRRSFVQVEPKNLRLLAFRKKAGPGMEARIVDVEGKQSPASITVDVSAASACETNLLGHKLTTVPCHGGRLQFESRAWKVQTFEII